MHGLTGGGWKRSTAMDGRDEKRAGNRADKGTGPGAYSEVPPRQSPTLRAPSGTGGEAVR